MNNTWRNSFAKFGEGTAAYDFPVSSSVRRTVTESFEENNETSTSNDGSGCKIKSEPQLSFQTNNFKVTKPTVFFDARILDYIAQSEAEARQKVVSQYANEIRILIQQDEFIDGEVSRAEHYMTEGYKRNQLDCISDAIMHVYESDIGEPHMLEGILTMVASVPYDAISPKGQIIAMGLLTHKSLSVRDKAIQCFEKWNSKKGLAYLKNISCTPRWLQTYADKVILYIERDGIE